MPAVTKMVTGSINSINGNRILSLFFIILPIENCITMTRNALSIDLAERGPIYKGLLPRSIQAWDNDCWTNKVIEEQPQPGLIKMVRFVIIGYQ